MVVSTLQFIVELPGISSLKEKRRIVKSLKDRLVHKFRVSAAEVDLLDSLRFAQIGAALVSNSQQFGESVLNKVLDFAIDNISGRIVDTKILSEQF